MSYMGSHTIYILMFIFLSACASHQYVQSNLPSPGKQCKILLNNKYAKNVKRNRGKSRVRLDDQPEIDQSKLQAQRMTNEEYLDQIEKVRKSLPSFNVENDCPPAFNKSFRKKKFNFGSLFK
jgi:hypothetical protein